eukprot:g8395.t1
MQSLIERNGARATVAPSMRELPLDDNPAAFAFADELFAGRIDVTVFFTGVGARALLECLETRFSRPELVDALNATTVVVRGPKPVVVLREWKIRIDHRAAEPNTWRELVETFDTLGPLNDKTVALQEYGKPNVEFEAELTNRGARVVSVPIYRWALPEDTGPLAEAVRATIAGEFDVLMFTSAQQVEHVLQVAEALNCKTDWLDAARRCVVASVGPTNSEALNAVGCCVNDDEPHEEDQSGNAMSRSSIVLKVSLLIALAAAFGYVYFEYRSELTLESVAQREAQFRQFQNNHPIGVFAVAFVIYVAVTGLSIPGATVLTLSYGWFFGFWPTLILVSFASTSGATLAFLSSRYVLRKTVQSRFGDRLEKFNAALKREGAFYLFALRLTPVVPFFVVNLVMGLTTLRVWTFWWVSQVGMLAGTVVYVYAGSQIPNAQALADTGVGEILTWDRIAALLALGLFPLLARWGMRFIRREPILPVSD